MLIKFRKINNIIFIFSVVIILSACGKQIIETGNESSDSSLLLEGRFDQSVIDTTGLPSVYKVSATYSCNDFYDFILNYSDVSSLSNKYYFLQFDKKGNVSISNLLECPVTVSDGKTICSEDVNSDIRTMFSVMDNISVMYNDFIFDSDGNFMSLCDVHGSVYNDSLQSYYFVYKSYIVSWNKNGELISFEENNDEIVFPEVSTFISDNSGDKYVLTSTGIITVDDSGKFVSKYFDFINSDIVAKDFVHVEIIDKYSFAGIYRNKDSEYVLACFNLNSKPVNGNALVLATSSLSDDLKNDIVNYNLADNGCRISVNDYSDKTTDRNIEEAWSLLRDDLLNGYRPDIVLNSTGYDLYLENRLSDLNAVVDIKNVLLKDKDLEGLSFSKPASDLFYNGESIYSIIPSYYYDTVVINSDLYTYYDSEQRRYNSYATNAVLSDALYSSKDARINYINNFLSHSGSAYIDYLSKTSFFAEGDFYTYLEYAKDLPSDSISASEYYLFNGIQNISPIYDVNCRTIGDMNLKSTVSCKGDYIDLGYQIGENQSGTINANCSYLIISNRKYTNECWDFIKKYFSDDYQTNLTNGIPVTANGYDAWKNRTYATATDPFAYTYVIDGETITVYEPSDEAVNNIISNVENCNILAFSDYKIKMIVLNYADQYFCGQITAEEAAQMIDNDIEAYLNSN